MSKLNVQLLIEAITQTEQYKGIAQQSAPVQCIYKTLYIPFINETSMRFSHFDYSQFTLDDVSLFEDYYDKELQRCEYQAHSLLTTFENAQPAASKANFI